MQDLTRRLLPRAAVLAVCVTVGFFAETLHAQSVPTDPPESRIHPPIGLTTYAHRIGPPGGVASQNRSAIIAQHHIRPPLPSPTRTRSRFDLFLTWLRVQLVNALG